jgi:hypothetical protein
MDDALRTLADANLALDAAEEALAAQEPGVAEARLDEVEAALASLRTRWRAFSPAARAVIGPAGREVRERRDALLKRLPKRRALADATPEPPDPEEETPPDADEEQPHGAPT